MSYKESDILAVKQLCAGCLEIEALNGAVLCPACELLAAGDPEGYRLRIKRAEANVEKARRKRNQVLGDLKKAKDRDLVKNLKGTVKDCEEYMGQQQAIIEQCRARLNPTKESLAQRRVSQNLSRAQLADVLGCTEDYVKKLETGKRPLSETALKWLRGDKK